MLLPHTEGTTTCKQQNQFTLKVDFIATSVAKKSAEIQ